MITNDQKKIVKQLIVDSSLTELTIDNCKSISAKTGLTIKQVEYAAIENGIEILRYRRNMGTLSFKGQLKLLESTAIIVGLGGLGGHVIEQITRTGIGKIICCDCDAFDETNLNRQILATEQNLNHHKSKAAAQRVASINSATECIAVEGAFQTIEPKYWQEANIVFDCLDNIDDRLILATQCTNANVNLIHGAIAGWYGQVALIRPNSDAMAKIYHNLHKGIEKTVGTPAFTAATAASIMVSKAIKAITGNDSRQDEALLFFDLLENQWQTLYID